jgi:uncharacterized BrkB/YihY/UPF0761 family membrane protein
MKMIKKLRTRYLLVRRTFIKAYSVRALFLLKSIVSVINREREGVKLCPKRPFDFLSTSVLSRYFTPFFLLSAHVRACAREYRFVHRRRRDDLIWSILSIILTLILCVLCSFSIAFIVINRCSASSIFGLFGELIINRFSASSSLV